MSNSYQPSLRNQLRETAEAVNAAPSSDFYKDLMDKIAFVDEMHANLTNADNDAHSDMISALSSKFGDKQRVDTQSDAAQKTARTHNKTVFYKECKVQTDVDAAAFDRLMTGNNAPDLTNVLSNELHKHLSENMKEISTIKLENGQLMEKAKHEAKLNGKLKIEVRRLQRYEAFFEKQKMKKYRNCGC